METGKPKSKQENWINFAKFMAILAVIIDHTTGVLFTNQNIAMSSYYSVSLFILVSGLLTYNSIDRHGYTYWKGFWNSIKKILFAYLVAVAIYTVAITKAFDVVTFLTFCLYCSASGPHYYVMLYIMLMLIARMLYDFLKIGLRTPWMTAIKDTGVALATLYISSWTTLHTNVLGIYGGVAGSSEERTSSCFA